MDFIRAHQLDAMLFMSGICFILTVMTLMPKFMSRNRRSILALMELSSMALLLFDRVSYLHRGDASELGGIIVRVGNGMVFFLTLLIPLLVTHYLRDLYQNEGGLERPPRRLRLCEVFFVIGTILIIVSQFTGLYYTFDDQNIYQRAPGLIVNYLITFMVVIVQESTIIKYEDRLKSGLVLALTLSLALPVIAAIIQYFCYGLSLINMTTVIVVIVFYVYAVSSLGEEVSLARVHEIEILKDAEQREAAQFVETTKALANAIDAKDRYTHGHSTRVAILSRQIAKEAGYSDEDCDQVYFAALLHDVGKIGVPDEVINKTGKLTNEEFQQIKQHPVLGYQILSSIKHSPNLSIGARYHHERYDGSGYPDGLSGTDIPEIARIIAVADAYDAMTSNRSYRNALPQQVVRDEIAAGLGTQFDYMFAAIMLRLIDDGKIEQILNG